MLIKILVSNNLPFNCCLIQLFSTLHNALLPRQEVYYNKSAMCSRVLTSKTEEQRFFGALTCMLSADIISVLNFLASSIPRRDFPVPVAPKITITGTRDIIFTFDALGNIFFARTKKQHYTRTACTGYTPSRQRR